MKKLIIILTVILCVQMCGNPVRRTRMEQETDGKGSSFIERVFISDRLQDSLENFLKLVDTTDYYISSKSPGKYCRHIMPDYYHYSVTLCCFTNNGDTIINFYGGIDNFIGYPASLKMHKVFRKKIAVGAKRVNNTMIAVNSYGNIAVDSVFDSLFLRGLDLEVYGSMIEKSSDFGVNVLSFFKEYIYNGKKLELVFTNEKKLECVDTVKNIQEVFR